MVDEPRIVDAPLRRLPPLLRQSWYGLNQAFRRRVAHLNITPDQYSLLRWVREAGRERLTQSQLTELMASDPNTITALVRRMEAAGLIEREPSKTDKRANLLRLTRLGLTTFARGKRVAIALEAEVLGAFSDADRETFLTLLGTLASAATKAAAKEV